MTSARLLLFAILMQSCFAASAQFDSGKGSNRHSYRPEDGSVMLARVYHIINTKEGTSTELGYGDEGTPCFEGGYECLEDYVSECTTYPEEDLSGGVRGNVVCAVKFHKSGAGLKPGDVKILRGISKGMDKECKRLLLDSPGWKISGNDKYEISNIEVYVVIAFKLRM